MTIPVFAAGAAVSGGAREGVSELDPGVHVDEACVHGRGENGHVETKDLCGSLEKCSVAEWLGRGEHDEQSSLRWERIEALRVRSLDPRTDAFASRHAEPACKLDDVRYAPELDQGKRVSVTLRDDLLADRGIDRPRHAAQEQRPRIPLTEPGELQFREPGEDVITDPRSCGTDERDPLGEEATSNETEDLR